MSGERAETVADSACQKCGNEQQLHWDDLVGALRELAPGAIVPAGLRPLLLQTADEIESLRDSIELIAAGTYTEKGAEDWAKFILRKKLPEDPNGFETRESQQEKTK